MSTKHVWHAVAALCLGLDWNQGADYWIRNLDGDVGLIESGVCRKYFERHPENDGFAARAFLLTESVQEAMAQATAACSALWRQVQAMRDELGAEAFERLYLKTKMARHIGYDLASGKEICLETRAKRKGRARLAVVPRGAP